MPRYKIADVVFDAQTNYEYTKNLCKDYLYTGDETPAFSCVITEQDIENEKSGEVLAPDYYIESLALYRKLCEYLLQNSNGIIFHSSAVMVDNEAYLFTALSGTGKSTHTRLWREMLKEKAVMINDDKPIIRYIDGEFYVYGTPWQGKHNLGTNTRAKIKAICKIYQAKDNVIRKLSPKEMLNTIMIQTLIPNDMHKMDILLSLIDKMLKSVGLYELGCNISREAAELSYGVMSKGE